MDDYLNGFVFFEGFMDDYLNGFVDDFFTIFKAVVIQQALGLEYFRSPSSEPLKCTAKIMHSAYLY